PLIASWIVLYLVSYVYFSYRGAALSVAWAWATFCLDAAFQHLTYRSYFTTFLTLVITVIIGIATIALNRVKEYDEQQLVKSRQKEALQRDRMNTLVNNLADAIISTDEHGVIRLFNAACLNLLDTNADLIGQSIDKVLHLNTVDGSTVKLLPQLKKAKSVTVDDSFIMPLEENEHLRLEVTYSPIRGEFAGNQKISHDGYVIIIRDVTKAKSLEEERDEFISVVSHELRTPIAITEGTISNAQLMAERTNDISKIKGSLGEAHEQVVFLAKMVNDLSTLSRAERGVADAAELIDLTELAHQLYNEYAPQAEAKGLHFNLSISPHIGAVSASRLYLHELLQNFITNSIKYTKEGQIDLTFKHHEDEIEFSVKDSGIGISKNERDKVFQKFYRSEDYRTRETGGTGLGLYVAAKLAHKLGCKINLKSRLNHGSTFSFTLPQARPAQQ
ncbi:MAG TPA: ATP-binding protein, partial [Dongiaceae bacterium]|nr:ATP-binding protein [Dongiaceae bacterium]